ncbi:MAG: 2-(1,2-epoxy-1,2-dihydrophenyl)acetyl-CoA isomerase PaaG [Thiolinea sp.]
MYQTIILSIADDLATLTLNRPDRLNSFTTEMHREVRDALQQIADSGARCLLLNANGRGFCAGQDLSDETVSPDSDTADIGAVIEGYYNPLVKTLTTLPMPVVCAVNGVAAGAGANIALACDIVLAGRSASFIQAFCKIGLLPDSGGTWTLPRLIGRGRAMALSMLGDKVSAEQAEQWGMIWRCVDDEQLAAESLKLAQHLATQPTRGLAYIKQAINASEDNTLDAQLALECELQREAAETHDYREGVTAFTEKRAPRFKGC